MNAKPEATRLPTLTEVLGVKPVDGDAVAARPAAAPVTDERVALVVEAVSARLDGMLEERLDETMAPLLAQFSRAVGQHAKAEVQAMLRDELPRLIADALREQA